MSADIVLRTQDAVTLRALPPQIVSVGAMGPQGATGATGPAGPGVPVGGTTGQVLAKSSATDYATEWDNRAFKRGIFASSNANAAAIPGVPIISSTFGFAVFTGSTLFSPIIVDEAFTVTDFVCYVSTAGSGTIQFAIYNATRDWRATTKIVDPTIGVSNSTTGQKTEAIAPVVLNPGRYFIAFACTSGGSPQVWMYNGACWGTGSLTNGGSGVPRGGQYTGIDFPDNPAVFGIGLGGWSNGSGAQSYPALLKGSFA